MIFFKIIMFVFKIPYDITSRSQKEIIFAQILLILRNLGRSKKDL